MSDLLNFGFSPAGYALGSEGSPSMPGTMPTGLEDPMEVMQGELAAFTEQTQRRYGEGSDVGGSVWDPRGPNALSSKPSDYRDSNMMRPDEIPVQFNASDDQLMGGDPVLARYVPDSTAFARRLHGMDIGLSQQGAATLADSLASYDSKILEGFRLPRPVEPRVTNELGLTTQHGGLPQAFFDPNAGVLKQGVPEAVDRVISQGAQFQSVDQNGVVGKYAPGTGPYDAMAKGLIAGPPVAQSGQTAARMRAYGGKLLQSPKNGGSGLQNAGGIENAGAPTPVGDDSDSRLQFNTAGQTAATGGGQTYGVESTNYVDSDVPTEDPPIGGDPAALTPEKKCSKWWWLLALVPVAAGGIYLATRKKRRGRK